MLCALLGIHPLLGKKDHLAIHPQPLKLPCVTCPTEETPALLPLQLPSRQFSAINSALNFLSDRLNETTSHHPSFSCLCPCPKDCLCDPAFRRGERGRSSIPWGRSALVMPVPHHSWSKQRLPLKPQSRPGILPRQ